jgi:hypothetical protein
VQRARRSPWVAEATPAVGSARKPRSRQIRDWSACYRLQSGVPCS